MELQKSISSFSSVSYVKKSYYMKILILLYEKRDYYGAQYEIDRMNKVSKGELKYSHNDVDMVENYSKISKIYEEEENMNRNESKSMK